MHIYIYIQIAWYSKCLSHLFAMFSSDCGRSLVFPGMVRHVLFWSRTFTCVSWNGQSPIMANLSINLTLAKTLIYVEVLAGYDTIMIWYDIYIYTKYIVYIHYIYIYTIYTLYIDTLYIDTLYIYTLYIHYI